MYSRVSSFICIYGEPCNCLQATESLRFLSLTHTYTYTHPFPSVSWFFNCFSDGCDFQNGNHPRVGWLSWLVCLLALSYPDLQLNCMANCWQPPDDLFELALNRISCQMNIQIVHMNKLFFLSFGLCFYCFFFLLIFLLFSGFWLFPQVLYNSLGARDHNRSQNAHHNFNFQRGTR